MGLLLVGLGLLVAGGLATVVMRSSRGTSVGVAAGVVGCLAAAIPAVRVLLGAPAESLRIAWAVPYGSFFVQIDPLSAFFLLPVLGLSALAAVYGAEYMRAGDPARPRATSWFFFNVLVASMTMVIIARNAILFLVAWEIMA